MSRHHSYLKSAVQILNKYKEAEPFALFLKKFFSQHKKYGSNDRKQIAHLCYCYFRLGKALMDIPVEERILTGLFLCSTEPNDMLGQLKPEWNEKANDSTEEKYSIIDVQSSMLNVFPWKEELSEGIDHKQFCESFFIQPDLFLRLRPGYESTVKEKLSKAEIDFKEIDLTCLSLPNASKIEDVIELDREAVVQDYSSQQTGGLFKYAILSLFPMAIGTKIKVWDCCAGSGGKSLLIYDISPAIDLTVSDKREAIIINLKKRFKKAGIKRYKSWVADLTSNQQPVIGNYDLIIADVPCTGSGTWSRTPEQLYYFDEDRIAEYALLQKKIVSNMIHHFHSGGYLLYITCSVFKKENEEIVDYIKQTFQSKIIKVDLLKGYDKKADTMFAALFHLSK